MKFWLSKNSEISLREQLARQIMLAIVSGDLRVGEKLPSVREMALRVRVHPNTVGQAYLWLQEKGWIVSRRGSGVFVKKQSERAIDNVTLSSEIELDTLILKFIRAAQTRGFSREQITARLLAQLEETQIKQILLVEPDRELREILALEIQNAINLPILTADSACVVEKKNALLAALEETARNFAIDTPKIILRLNSVQSELRGKERPAEGSLVGIASRWETFLSWSKTMLIAAGIKSEQIVLRNAKLSDWRRGLSSCEFVIADSLTAERLRDVVETRVFRLIAEESLNELQNLVDWR